MAVLDDLLAEVPLPLDAPGAAAFVVQIRFELDGEGARGFDHRVEARNGSPTPGNTRKKLRPAIVPSPRFARSKVPGSVRLATLNAGSPSVRHGERFRSVRA